MPVKHRVLSTADEMSDLQEGWESLRAGCRATVFLSYDWVSLWLRHFGSLASPRIVVLEEGGELRAIAPLVLTVQQFRGIRIGRLLFPGNPMGAAETYDLGIMYRGEMGEIVDGVMAALTEIDWNLIQLLDMHDDPLSRALYERIAAEWQAEPPLYEVCPFVNIPPSGEVIALIGSRTRRTIRKMTSTLEKGGRLGYRLAETPDEVLGALKVYFEHHRERWKRKGGSIFSDERISAFMMDAGRILAAKGIAEVHEILIDGEVASQMLCIKDGECLRAYRIGMNDKFIEHSPGNLVAYAAMKKAQARGFKVFDFGKGKSEFKYRMGSEDRQLFGIQAKRGSLALMSRIASLPGIRTIITKTGAKESALKKIYE